MNPLCPSGVRRSVGRTVVLSVCLSYFPKIVQEGNAGMWAGDGVGGGGLGVCLRLGPT